MYKITGFRHILFLILAAAALVSLSAVLYWEHLDAAMMQRERGLLFSSGKTLAGKFDYLMDAELQVLASVGESLEGLRRTDDVKELELYLARQNRRCDFEMTGFQFPDGRTYFSDGSEQNNFLSPEEISAAYKNGSYISAPEEGSERGSRIIAAIPVYGNGKNAGVLFASHVNGFYENAMNSELFLENAHWFVADFDGKILLKRSDAEHDKTLNALLRDASCFQRIAPAGGSARCALPDGNYFVSSIPLDYNNWRLLALRSASAPGYAQREQLAAALLMCGSVVVVLGFLLLLITRAYRRHSLELYSAGFIYHVTGLGNHNYFQSNFPAAAAALKKNGTPFTLTIININRFKAINDIYGFELGDGVLRHAARVLKEEVQPGELLGHSSSDIFLLLLACPDRAEFNGRLEKILSRVSRFCPDDKLCVDIAVTAGVYLADEDVPFYIMTDRANMALNFARSSPGQSFAFYNDTYREQIKHITDIESRMNAAFEEKQFKVFLQPKYNFQTGEIESAEALVRWLDPRAGVIPPDEFIPVFEKNGFVLKLDMFVLEETVKLLARRRSEGKRITPVGVNFSRLHLEDARFTDFLSAIVDRYGLPRKFIEIELTESIAFDKSEVMKTVIDGLHARGFSAAMDDFGAGYSSLNVLKDLRFDVVKLDKEFLARGESDARTRRIISGAADMIKKLGCVIVSEGVETKEQAEFLKGIGCDLAQGYFFSRPLPPEEFEKLLDGGTTS